MDDNDIQQACAWLKANAWLKMHKPRTAEQLDAMDAETMRLYKHNMNIIRAYVDAWFQEHYPKDFAALLIEAMRGFS